MKTEKKTTVKAKTPAKKVVNAKAPAQAKKVASVKKPAFEHDLFACYYNAFQRYFDFKGRTGRYGYWAFVAINFLIASIIFCFVSGGIPALDSLYSMIVLIPSWALSVRRLHDINKSGWWIGAALIGTLGLLGLEAWQTQNLLAGATSLTLDYVILGWSILLLALGCYILVLSFFKGTKGANKYGAEPNI